MVANLGKRNKRISLHQKYKVAKKVRQHQREVKKNLKKQKPKKSKLMEIPMDVPFKATILKEIEETKLKEKEILKKRLLALNKLKNKVVVNEFDALKAKLLKNPSPAMVAELRKLMDEANVIVEVIDARDPIGTRSLELEKEIKEKNATLIFALNKIDLVPATNVASWMQHLSKEATVFPIKCVCASASVYGTDDLVKHLRTLGKDLDRLVVAVVGLANSGKSSLINSIKKRAVCVASTMAGQTRVLQRVAVDGLVTLVDSPAVLVAAANDVAEKAMRGCVRPETMETSSMAAAVYERCDKAQLSRTYMIKAHSNYDEFIQSMALVCVPLKKGGVANVRQASLRLIEDWCSGKIVHYTLPPTSDSVAAISADQVAAIAVLTHKNVTKCVTHSIVESTGPLKTVVDCEALSGDNVDDEEEEEEEEEDEEDEEEGSEDDEEMDQ